jgi:hypothetical protein
MSPREELERWRNKRSFRVASVDLECSAATLFLLIKGTRSPGRALANRIERVTGISSTSWDRKRRVRIAARSSGAPASEEAKAS